LTIIDQELDESFAKAVLDVMDEVDLSLFFWIPFFKIPTMTSI
jgi:hypothetical protein